MICHSKVEFGHFVKSVIPRKRPSVREGKHPVARKICLESSNSASLYRTNGSSTSSKGGVQCSKH